VCLSTTNRGRSFDQPEHVCTSSVRRCSSWAGINIIRHASRIIDLLFLVEFVTETVPGLFQTQCQVELARLNCLAGETSQILGLATKDEPMANHSIRAYATAATAPEPRRPQRHAPHQDKLPGTHARGCAGGHQCTSRYGAGVTTWIDVIARRAPLFWVRTLFRQSSACADDTWLQFLSISEIAGPSLSVESRGQASTAIFPPSGPFGPSTLRSHFLLFPTFAGDVSFVLSAIVLGSCVSAVSLASS
jgi:hypothetical protein